jgi:hypothetical protein
MTTRKKRKRKRKRKKQKRKRTKLTKKRRCCREVIAHEKRKERESAVHYNIKERERREKLILVINLIFVKQTQQKLRSLTGGVHFIAIGIHSHQAYNGPRFGRTDYSAKRA